MVPGYSYSQVAVAIAGRRRLPWFRFMTCDDELMVDSCVSVSKEFPVLALTDATIPQRFSKLKKTMEYVRMGSNQQNDIVAIIKRNTAQRLLPRFLSYPVTTHKKAFVRMKRLFRCRAYRRDVF